MVQLKVAESIAWCMAHSEASRVTFAESAVAMVRYRVNYSVLGCTVERHDVIIWPRPGQVPCSKGFGVGRCPLRARIATHSTEV